MLMNRNYKLERLQNGESFVTKERGNSMVPLIKSNQEHKLAPATLDDVNVGDIVYCKVSGRFFTHLVTAKDLNKGCQISNNHGHVNGWTRLIYGKVVEGPIDSLFLNNCIASAGGDLISAIRDYDKSNFIIVYDNEPKSKTTREKIKKTIEAGYRVCIWPNNLKFKDINKMVQEGMKVVDIERIIRENTFSGLEAQIKLTFWRR